MPPKATPTIVTTNRLADIQDINMENINSSINGA